MLRFSCKRRADGFSSTCKAAPTTFRISGFRSFPLPRRLSDFWGPLPIGYVKLVKGNFSAEVGELPTLIGAEYTFSFENLNIERGLLWNQETAVSRGIQLNETYKKLSLSFSWNDGFYSNRYNWLSGSAAYAFNAANTLSFVAGGNLGNDAVLQLRNARTRITAQSTTSFTPTLTATGLSSRIGNIRVYLQT